MRGPDHATPVVSIASLGDATEGGANGTVRFAHNTMNHPVPVVVNYSIGGTATNGTDYATLSGTVTIAPFTLFTDVTVSATDDSTSEATETVVLTLTSGTGYTIGAPLLTGVNLLDNDAQVIWVGVEYAGEDDDEGRVVFNRLGDLSGGLTVNYAVTGTATSGTDYTALSGSVTFAADEDRVELWVEALGDNTVDDAETVIATLTGAGTTYELDSGDYIATVTIGDQPLTVSVIALNDGTEGGTNPQFRFSRAGDLSEELTVYYTVTGTATSGTDFTALAGSVTFPEDEDEVDVTVYLSGDSTGEHTETITVTLDEAEEYLFGNDSDTVFVFDNDTRQLVWTGLGSDGDWTNSDNWYIVGTTTNATPTEYDDFFFTTSGTGNVTNVGDGLSSLYGLHITGTYNGTLTLANGLSVGTFEQTAGTLVMDDEAHDLVVTKALLWSGGTLGATDDGADVVIDDASARIDPPDTGSMSTSSTLRFIGTTVATFLPGTLNFAGGNGLYIAGKVKALTTPVNLELVNPNYELNLDVPQIELGNTGTIEFLRKKVEDGAGWVVSDLPIKSSGRIWLGAGIQIDLRKGRVDGGTGPSLKVTGGAFDWVTGSAVVTDFGMVIAGGQLTIRGDTDNDKAGAGLKGDFTLQGGELTYVGVYSSGFKVDGNINWTGGKFAPRINSDFNGECDLLLASKTVTVAANVDLDPQLLGGGALTVNSKWTFLVGEKGLTGTPPALPAGISDICKIEPQVDGMKKWWEVRKK